MREVDWQMVAFVFGSLMQEYAGFVRVPKIYYWDSRFKKFNDDDDNKVA